MSEKYSLREAAEVLGITVKAIRHRIKVRGITPQITEGPTGALYLINAEQLEALRAPVDRTAANGEPPEIIYPGQTPKTEPVEVSSGLAEPEGNPYEIYEPLVAPNTVPVEVHLQALRLVEHAQLQLERAQLELQSTRNVLSEQAESLAEKEAYAKQAATLEIENRLNRERWESERAELLKTIQETKGKVDWLERRVPKWVRKVFGAG